MAQPGITTTSAFKTPAYPNARAVATTVEEHFTDLLAAARQAGFSDLTPQPDARTIETIIDASFWASLRREEGYVPKVSVAFLPPERSKVPLKFERKLPLTPAVLARLGPAVERSGIHLGVWSDDTNGNGLHIWGTTRFIPKLCFVLEVIEPGLLVVKYRRGQETKYVNVVVLKGDEIKVVDEQGTTLPDCPALLTRLLGFGSQTPQIDSVNVLVQLAASMRQHGRGGALLVVPQGSDAWHSSIVHPINYAATPSFSELADLMRRDPNERNQPTWQEALIDAVDEIAGLTAVDGAAIITDQYELLAFGAKISRSQGSTRVDHVVLTEPVVGTKAQVVQPLELGGTRHLSAAQFVHDQRDALALVASQDGRFTVFAWSPCEEMVHAHRVETLLL
jgi:Probable sensor domain DACNV